MNFFRCFILLPLTSLIQPFYAQMLQIMESISRVKIEMNSKRFGFPSFSSKIKNLRYLLLGLVCPVAILLLSTQRGWDRAQSWVSPTKVPTSERSLFPISHMELEEMALASPLHIGSFPYTFEFSSSVMPGGGTNSYTQADGTNVTFQFAWDSNPPSLSTSHDTGSYSGLSSANFWITSGLGTSAYTMTLSFSGTDDVVSLGFDIVHINAITGGDKVTLVALTESGATLTPTYTQPSDPDYTLTGNVMDAIDYDSAPEFNLGVNISTTSADPIASVSLIWEECGICTSAMHGVGISDIDFSIVSPDQDGDGIGDPIDIDDDNDGILDEVESCGSVGGGTGTVVVEILTDDWAQETSWTLKDASNTTVLSDSYSSSDDNTTFTYTLNNASGSYSFEIDDSANDGICCGYGTGHYEIKVDGSTIVGGSGSGVGNFGSSATESFTVGTSFACLSGDPSGDADSDGTLNYEDADFCTLNSNGVCSSLDLDGDGIINQFDLDSDGDGIADIVEAGGTDSDGDGQVAYATPGDPATMTDADSDGLADAVDDQNSGSGVGEVTSGTAWADGDTDSDGLANRVDMDSDADGCPDALEGAGSYTFANINVDNQLTAASNGDGIPGGSLQAIGSSQNAGTQSNECTGCASGSTLFVDSDGDGVGDKCDLDDDNDAISDWEEGRAEVWVVSGGWNSNNGAVGDHDGSINSTYITSVTNPLTVGAGLTFNIGGNDDFSEDTGWSTGSSMAIYGVDQSTMADAISNNDYLELQFTTAASWTGEVELSAFTYAQYLLQGTSTIIGGQYAYGLQISDDNFATSTVLKRSELIGFAGSDASFSTSTFGGADYTNYKVEFPSFYTLSPGTSYRVRMYLFDDADGKVNLDDLYFNVYHSQDLDGDNTANYLDLDTDGDDCPDGVEGSGSLTFADLDVNDRVDFANTTPSGVDGNGIPNASSGGQGIGDSQNAGTLDADCAGGAGAPIELLSFSLISLSNGTIKLKWETLTETNNDYFTVERSRDAEAWEILTQIKGAGDSQEILKYETIDDRPIPGTSYYRLKQTDFDGKFSYSNILDIYIKAGQHIPLSAYPNPTTGPIKLTGPPDEIQSFTLFDLQGRDMTQQVEKVEEDYYQVFLDLSDLPKGVYLLQTANQTVKVRRE